ncbi:hypothetical protein LZ31DRAFT_557202 [Colletotrichum somersetense]|nr:hypothetical protein LZ31DRAFT_557202 [Colletotrichum somersetense]
MHVGDYNFYNRRWKKAVSAKDQRPQHIVSPSATNTAIHPPAQPTTPSRKSSDAQYQSTPATTVTPAASPVGLPVTTLAAREEPTVNGSQHQRKRRRSAAAVERQTPGRDRDATSTKKARKAARKEMQLALRLVSSAESLA